jgi:hypothetical protein
MIMGIWNKVAVDCLKVEGAVPLSLNFYEGPKENNERL